MDSEDLRAKASANGSSSTTPIGNLNQSFPHDPNLTLNEVLDGFDLQETRTDYSKVYTIHLDRHRSRRLLVATS